MASNVVEVILRLKNEMEAGLKNASNQVTQFSKLSTGQLLLAAGAFVGLTREVTKSMNAAVASQQAQGQLALAMQKAGTYTREAWQAQIDYADSLQHSVAADDAQITAVQTLLTQFGVLPGQLNRTTQATLDMAAALKMDASSAALIVAKSIGTSVAMISRYIGDVKGAAGSTERFNSVLAGMEGKFSDAAKTAWALASPMDKLKKEIGELTKTILGPATTELRKYVNVLAGHVITVADFLKKHEEMAAAIGKATLALVGAGGLLAALTLYVKMAPAVTAATQMMLGAFGKIAAIIVASVMLIKDWLPTMPEDFELAALAADNLSRAMEYQKQYWKPEPYKITQEALDALAASMDAVTVAARNIGGVKPPPEGGHPVNAPIPMKWIEDVPDVTAITLVETQDLWDKFFGFLQSDGKSAYNDITDWTDAWATNMGNAFAGMLDKGYNFCDGMKQAFKSLAQMIIAEIGRIAAKWAALAFLKFIGLAVGGAAGGATGTVISGTATAGETVLTSAGPGAGATLGAPSLTVNLTSYDAKTTRDNLRYGELGRELARVMGGY